MYDSLRFAESSPSACSFELDYLTQRAHQRMAFCPVLSIATRIAHLPRMPRCSPFPCPLSSSSCESRHISF
nr:hypothetical protein CFP56_21100 [Quercus suber]